ncbi:uncharacterized protein DNG_00489 [Cephalotrichum gorgonifer]|uniref:C2H2-type domain-containing protein n=1 Tax=Cephalotrichum gorgonifer TaxID=2041049 RepID=A0AAE8MQV1_9PEZI|nr:uncharacterized protein DNG_00489 [Cephalotrichum gorgonifer]
MASDQGQVVTEPSLQPSQPAHTAPAPQTSNADILDPIARANPLKRSREESPSSPSPTADEPSQKATRFALRTTSPIQLTAAVAALEAERRRREEFGQEMTAVHDTSSNSVLESLIRSNEAMSQPTDAHTSSAPPTAAMDAAERPATSLPAPISMPLSSAQIESSTSAGLGANGDPNQVGDASMAGAPVTESPTPMDLDPNLDDAEAHASQHDDRTTSASLSYPGPLHTPGPMPGPGSRTMSYPLPTSSAQGSPTSSGGPPKKHVCEYCETEFTRHHNLKSHLLTHSHEKPFKCDQCDMRFRRLHDLKRHSKLHTGEKPHVCPKCDRKFARGDALARHSKGAGGCAGRRSSMGTFIEDDINTSLADADDSRVHDHRMHPNLHESLRDNLPGNLYAKYAADAAIAEEERMRQQSLPNLKAPQGAGSPGGTEGIASQAQAYASTAPSRGASGNGLYPPGVDRNSVSTTASPSIPRSSTGNDHTPGTSVSSLPTSMGNGHVYSQNGVTESPRPLSPSPGPGGRFHGLPDVPEHPGEDTQAAVSQRLLCLTQPQQYARRDSDRRTPPNVPLSAGTGGTPKQLANAGSSDGRYATAGQNGPTTPQSGGRAGSGTHTLDGTNNMFAGDISGLWAYIHALEERVSQVEKADREKQAVIATLTSSLEALQKRPNQVQEHGGAEDVAVDVVAVDQP